MDSDNKEKIYCDDDGECYVCDKLAIDTYYNNHLKSQTHINNSPKSQQLNITNNSTSSQYYYYKMNTKTNLLEDYIDLVDSTKEQNTYIKRIIILFTLIVSLFLFYLPIKHLNE